MELCYTSGKGTFLYLNKSIFRPLAYSEVEAYSKPCQFQNLGIFITQYIFRTLSKNSYLAQLINSYLIRIFDIFDELSGRKTFAHAQKK